MDNVSGNEPRDYTTRELADLAGLDQSRIRQLLLAGVFKGAYHRAGRWFIPGDKARTWLREREVEK